MIAALPRKNPPDSEVAKILAELQAWCEAEYGRQAKLAKALGVNRRRVTDYFAGRTSPTWATGLKIQKFLAELPAAERPGRPSQKKPRGPDSRHKP